MELVQLRIERLWYYPRTTIGKLYINDEFFCYTLEDTVRPFGIKVPGDTAIWDGTYIIELEYSERFDRILPEIKDVPFFSETKLHGGNTHKDTLGCPLIAFNRDGAKIWGSAEKELVELLRGKKVILTVVSVRNMEK